MSRLRPPQIATKTGNNLRRAQEGKGGEEENEGKGESVHVNDQTAASSIEPSPLSASSLSPHSPSSAVFTPSASISSLDHADNVTGRVSGGGGADESPVVTPTSTSVATDSPGGTRYSSGKKSKSKNRSNHHSDRATSPVLILSNTNEFNGSNTITRVTPDVIPADPLTAVYRKSTSTSAIRKSSSPNKSHLAATSSSPSLFSTGTPATATTPVTAGTSTTSSSSSFSSFWKKASNLYENVKHNISEANKSGTSTPTTSSPQPNSNAPSTNPNPTIPPLNPKRSTNFFSSVLSSVAAATGIDDAITSMDGAPVPAISSSSSSHPSSSHAVGPIASGRRRKGSNPDYPPQPPPLVLFDELDISDISFLDESAYLQSIKSNYNNHKSSRNEDKVKEDRDKSADPKDVSSISSYYSARTSTQLSDISVLSTSPPPDVISGRVLSSSFVSTQLPYDNSDYIFFHSFYLLALLQRVFAHPQGGYLTLTLFFPIRALYSPQLRLPALSLKVSSLSSLLSLLSSLISTLEYYDGDVGKSIVAIEGFIDDTNKLQNELAFSLTNVVERHDNNNNSTNNSNTNNTNTTTGRKILNPESDDSSTSLSPTTGPTVPGPADDLTELTTSTSESVKRLSERVKLFGYGVMKSANRIKSATLTDKLNDEQRDKYVSTLIAICEKSQQLIPYYLKYKELILPPLPSMPSINPSLYLISLLQRVGEFYQEVLITFVLEDFIAILTRYVTVEQARFTFISKE